MRSNALEFPAPDARAGTVPADRVGSATSEQRGRTPDVTLIMTVVERPETLDELYSEYALALRSAGYAFEVIITAEPFYRSLLAPLEAVAADGEPVRIIGPARTVGETALLRLGIEKSRGRIIVAVPAYRQVKPEAATELIAAVENGADLAVAWRWPRRDALINRVQNRALHLVTGRLAHSRLHDVACGLRAARGDVLREIPLYGDFARFLPLIALHRGYRVVEVPVAQHVNDLRGRLYRPGVYLRRLVDLLGLFFLLRFTEKPLRFFGLIGSVLALPGLIITAILGIERIAGHAIGHRPLLLLGVLLITLGIQAIALGLIGEMIVHFSINGRRSYRLFATAPAIGAAATSDAPPVVDDMLMEVEVAEPPRRRAD